MTTSPHHRRHLALRRITRRRQSVLRAVFRASTDAGDLPVGCRPALPHSGAPCPVPAPKIILFFRNTNQGYISFHPAPLRRGVAHRHGRWVRDAVDAAAHETNAFARGRRSRVVLTPRRWRQVSRKQFPRGDGGKKARSPGRARYKLLKPLRREGWVFPAVSVVTMLVWFFHFHARLRVRLRARLSLRPCFRGQKFLHNLGASRRGQAVVCLQSQHRHCERSEAIHSLGGSRGLLRRKRSSQ
jgi:hypothetical protein